jgi:photosystem II stability/assembly factor-like uncharacterized protein
MLVGDPEDAVAGAAGSVEEDRVGRAGKQPELALDRRRGAPFASELFEIPGAEDGRELAHRLTLPHVRANDDAQKGYHRDMVRRSRPFALALVGLLVAAALAAGPARANGRYPQTVKVTFRPGDPAEILVPVTFGFVVSLDDGATWRWTCEGNVGYSGIFDPIYAIDTDGAIWVTTTRGLRVSHDGGCNFTTIGDPIGDQWVGDVHIATDRTIWVVTSNDGLPNDVFVSHDHGATFVSAGLFDTTYYYKSVRTAPSDPSRVYVSGYRLADPAPLPLLLRRDADDQPWTELPFSYNDESQLLLLEVSPVDPDVVFMRINGEDHDELLRSADGGMSWDPKLNFAGDGANLVAFTSRSADGLEWLAGTVRYGVKLSSDGGLEWTDAVAASLPRMACAGRRPADGKLFACGTNWDPDYMALGTTDDGGNTWHRVFRFSQMNDQLDCPADSGHATECGPLWPGIMEQFQVGVADAGPDATVEHLDAGDQPAHDHGCGGCQIGMGSVLLIWPWRRRRAR